MRISTMVETTWYISAEYRRPSDYDVIPDRLLCLLRLNAIVDLRVSL